MSEITLKAIKVKDTVSFRDRKEYLDFLKEIPEGTEILIKISDKRSLNQNSIYHAWITLIASEIGESFDTTKIYLTCRFFGCTEKEVDGIVLTIPVSTSRLDKKTFAEGLQSLYLWALEDLNMALPNKDTITKHLKQKEQ